MHPNGSEWIRKPRKARENLKKLAKTLKNFAKASKKFAKNRRCGHILGQEAGGAVALRRAEAHDVDDDENKIQIDDAFLERSRDALDAFDRRLLTVSSMSFSKSTARTCENASSLIPIELASFVSCANAKTGLNVKSTFERLAKRALKRREKERF